MSLQVVRSLPERIWREHVLGHPDGNVFHTPELAEVFRRTESFEPELWAVVKERRILALLLPVRVTLADGFVMRRLTTRSIAFGGVLVSPGEEGCKALSRLLTVYSKGANGRSLFTELRNMTDQSALQAVLQRHRYTYEEHLNYLIDLARPGEAVFCDIGPRTRKNIRQALNKGCVQVELITTKQGLAACYEILCQSYENARVPLAGWPLFEAAFDILAPKKMIRFTLAKVNGLPTATSVDLLYKGTIFGWYGGVVRSGRHHAANEVLTWEILRWGAENGYRTYDFGGAGRPGDRYGVRDFKAKFGGRLVCYGRNTCVHSPGLFRLSKIGYGVLRTWLYGRKRRTTDVASSLKNSSPEGDFYSKDAF